ncbi:MAG: methyltransferase domain-containing protein [Bacteroidetes bacterium]|nr:MAG: methyltransferase domain-containing protein [Bacteroidota bacterium]
MDHYDENYYSWYRRIGEFGGEANLFKFRKYIRLTDRVIDFGCGGGYLLKNIECAEKIGIEISETAREHCRENGIEVVHSAAEIENEWADVIISNHVLGHTCNPFDEIRLLAQKLKTGGKMVFVFPHERRGRYKSHDVNQIMYTWSEMNAGNLFANAGFDILEVKTLRHRWPPKFHLIRKIFGRRLFHLACWIYGAFYGRTTQIRVVAQKPPSMNHKWVRTHKILNKHT